MNSITVFTPTYNRAYILPRLYESLCNQTCKDFCWLIVDDGSQDDTNEIVSKWIEKSIIEIKYIYKQNGGKMRAHNVGVKYAESELFVCVDSDDYLTANSIEMFLNTWKNNLRDNKSISGIVAYRGKSDNLPMVNEFPKGVTVSKLSDLYDKGFKGDTTLVFRTAVLKEYLFPEIPEEKFITEAYIYDQIDQKYSLFVLREIGIVCEYQEDGYTRNNLKLERDNPKGWAVYYRQKANFATNMKKKLRYSAYANCFELMSHSKHIKCDYKILNAISFVIGLKILHRYKKGFETLK